MSSEQETEEKCWAECLDVAVHIALKAAQVGLTLLKRKNNQHCLFTQRSCDLYRIKRVLEIQNIHDYV